MNVGSLFSGIGGLDLGLERAGFTVKWQVEIDPYCLKVLEKHWPTVTRYGDIRTLDPRDLESVDLVCGGFPCQPTSRAGRQLGKRDPRWLWPAMADLICMVGPRYVLVENPPGLLDGEMGDVLGDLAEMGFDAEWGVFSACARGAPHTRERVFIVAYRDSARPQDVEGWQGPSPPRRRIFAPHAADERVPEWLPEPTVDRVVDGFSPGVGELGNSVVPQVAEWVGRQILQSECAA